MSRNITNERISILARALPTSNTLEYYTELSKAASIITDELREEFSLKKLEKLITGRFSDKYGEHIPSFKFLLPYKEIKYPEIFFKHSVTARSIRAGFLHEVNRVYYTLDRNLYLWDYLGSSDLEVYDDQCDNIQTVGIVKPKKGMFPKDVEYLLIVSTSSQITFVGLACDKSDSPTRNPEKQLYGKLHFYRTGMTIPHNLCINKIVGTKDGRAFLGADDGHIYEISYQPNESWFFYKCSLVNLTIGTFSKLLPSFLTSIQDAIVRLYIDPWRNILYALTYHNSLQIYYLGANGDSFKKVSEISNIVEEIRSCCGGVSFGSDINNYITSIHPISPKESNNIDFLLVTSRGYRLYYSLNFNVNRGDLSFDKPNNICLLHIRYPPRYDELDKRTTFAIKESYYSNGLFIATSPYNKESDDINLYFIDPSNFYKVGDESQSEAMFSLSINAHVWSIYETPLKLLNSLSNDKDFSFNELSGQFMEERREFVFLTSKGITIFKKQRPIDILSSSLFESGGNLTNTISYFFSLFSLDISCAMCLHMACMKGSIIGASGNYEVNISKFQLVSCQRRLTILNHFLDRNKFFSDPPYSGKEPSCQTQDDLRAWQLEQYSLHACSRLVVRSIDMISFLLEISEPRMVDTLKLLSSSKLSNLNSLTFGVIVSTPEGKEFARDIIIKSLGDKRINANTLSAELKGKCGSIFLAEDIYIYKGHENLTIAKALKGDEQLNYLKLSIKFFCDASINIPMDKLNTILMEFVALHYHSGALEICLQCIGDLNYISKSRIIASKSEVVFEINRRLKEYYQLCVQILTDPATLLGTFDLDSFENYKEAHATRIPIFQKIFNFPDENLQRIIYEWLVSNGKTDILMECRSQCLVNFLCENVQKIEYLNILYRVLVEMDRNKEACSILYNAASFPGYDIKFGDRLMYLIYSHAFGYAGNESFEVLDQIKEKIEMGHLQEAVYGALLSMPEELAAAGRDAEYLNRNFIPPTELYHDWVVPFKLFDLGFKFISQCQIDDMSIVTSAWTKFIESCITETLHSVDLKHMENFAFKFKSIATKYANNGDRVFPTEFLIHLLEQYVIDHFSKYGECIGFIVDILVDIKISYSQLFISYHNIVKSKMSPFDIREYNEYLTREVLYLLDIWLKEFTKKYPNEEELRKSFPLFDVSEAVEDYSSSATFSGSKDLLEEVQVFQKSLLHSFPTYLKGS